MGINVLWYTDRGPSKIHRASQIQKENVSVGGFPLDCGRWAPDGLDVSHITWTGRPITCKACAAAQHRPPPEYKPDLREVGWARYSEYTGDPIGMPRMHLTRDGRHTCCGRTIPQSGTETREYQIQEFETSRKCARCFTEEREDELRQQR